VWESRTLPRLKLDPVKAGDEKPILKMGFFIGEMLKNSLIVGMVASTAFPGGRHGKRSIDRNDQAKTNPTSAVSRLKKFLRAGS
jgi:hypothetical protein